MDLRFQSDFLPSPSANRYKSRHCRRWIEKLRHGSPRMAMHLSHEFVADRTYADIFDFFRFHFYFLKSFSRLAVLETIYNSSEFFRPKFKAVFYVLYCFFSRAGSNRRGYNVKSSFLPFLYHVLPKLNKIKKSKKI